MTSSRILGNLGSASRGGRGGRPQGLALGPGPLHAGLGPLDQGPFFELSAGGGDVEHGLAHGGGGVDPGLLEGSEAAAAGPQLLQGGGAIEDGAKGAIEPPDDDQ